MIDIESTYKQRAEKILTRAANGTEVPQHLLDKVYALVDDLYAAARDEGMYALALDLVDTKLVDDEAVEFMIEDKGMPDPRKHSS